jgi:hypothetical protein
VRRVVPPSRLRIRHGACAAVCGLAHGPEGWALSERPAPAGATRVEWPLVALSVASPYPTAGLSTTARGTMVLSWTPGVVRCIVLPDLAQAFERRPPGATEARGAGRANAALLRADDGWRAVVLPSIGDRLADLGPGPVAISADGRQVALGDEGATQVVALADGSPVAEYPGAVDAAAFAGDRLWLAAGGAVGPAEALTPGTGAPVRSLVGAATADRVLALAADGQVWRYGTNEPPCMWKPVIADVTAISLSEDGEWATLAGPEAVAVVRARDGAIGLYVGGASSIALAFADRVVVGGDWGMALIVPIEESA